MSSSGHFDSSDRFDVIRRIGAGGMGIVLLAEDQVLRRRVVLKQLRESSALAEKRLQREAQAVSRVDHPNVVKVFDLVERDSEIFVVMEYVEGRTLSEILESAPLPVGQALGIANQVADGLHAVHAEGVVHRDLKPANIMVTKDGTVKILDFGLAHFSDRTTLSAQNEIMGTPVYMSPEQMSGKPVGPRSDLFALGVIVYEMLTGTIPYDAPTAPELIAQILSTPPESPRQRRREVPERLNDIVLRVLSKKPVDRFESAGALARELSQLASEQGLALDTSTVALSRGRVRRRMQRTLPIGGLALLTLVAATLLVRYFWPSSAESTLLILPFEAEQASEDHAWLSTGVMDDLIGSLERAEGIRVVSRRTVASALGTTTPSVAGFSAEQVRGIVRELAADYLITGEVRTTSAQDGPADGRRPEVGIRCVLRALDPNRTVERWDLDIEDLRTGYHATIERLASELAEDLGVSRGVVPGGPREIRRHTDVVEAQRWFEEGLELFRRQDSAAAAGRFRAAVAADTTYVRAYWYLYRAEADQQKASKALNRAMMFRRSAPEPIRSIVRATHLERLGRREEAISQFENVLEEHPGSIEARLSLARLYGEADRWADAIGEFEAARVQNPFDYSLYPLLATARIEIGQTQRAISLLESWRNQRPEDVSPLLWLIRLKVAVGEGIEALALCDSVESIAPGAIPGMRGAVLRDLGRLDEAEAEFRVLDADPPARWRPNVAKVMLAHLALTRGDYEEGTRWIDQALKIHDDLNARNTAGRLAVRRGDLGEAERHLDAIAAMIGDDHADTTKVEEMGSRRWYFNLAGEIEAARGNWEEAVRLHRAAARYSGRWDGATFNSDLARACLAAGDTTAAATAFARSIALQRTFAEGALGLASIEIARGRHEAAREVLEPLAAQWQQADPDYSRRQDLERLLEAANPK